MKQYCKYCEHCGYKSENGKDVYSCLRLGFVMRTASAALRPNVCKSFVFGGHDVKTGREYVPIEERRTELGGQMMF